jgi:hypothetical protein
MSHHGGRDHLERHCASVRLSLLEVAVNLPHGVRDVGVADDRLVSGCRERIQRCGFHLHGQGAARPSGGYRRRGLAKWRIRRPGRPR